MQGNESEVKEVTVKDVTAPTSPTVNEVTETSTSVIGTAEARSTVIVNTNHSTRNSNYNDRREVFGYDCETKSRNKTYSNCNG